MKLFWYEFQKIAMIPMIWFYLFGCVLLNLSNINYGIAHFIDFNYLEYTNQVAKEIGWALGEEFEKELEKMPDHTYKARLLEETQGLGDYYQSVDMEKMSQVLLTFSYTEKDSFLWNQLNHKFQSLGHQVSQIESVSLWAGSQSQLLFDLLYDQLFPSILLQICILSVIIMMFLTDYEEMQKTHLLVYSSRSGRKIQAKKLLCGCFIALLFYSLLSLLTFTAFFLKFDLSGVLLASMDSPFLTITMNLVSFPFITWNTLTFLDYFFATYLLCGTIILIYTGISWCISLIFRNMYFSFGLFSLCLFVEWQLYLQFVYQPFFLGKYLMGGNPLVLAHKIPLWFTYMGYLSLIPLEETWGILSNFSITLLLTLGCYHFFKRKDLHS